MNNDTRDTIIGGIAFLLFLAAVGFIAYTFIGAIVNAIDPDSPVYTWKEIASPRGDLQCWITMPGNRWIIWCESK